MRCNNDIENYYNKWTENKVDGKTGEYKKYKDGTIKKRLLRPPIGDLKLIQSRIKDKIFSKIALLKK